MKRLIWLVMLIISISGCDMQDGAIAPPAKPNSVPENAFWVGGHEGGVFVLVSKNKSEVTYYGTIYFDANGDVWYQGKFKYTGDSPFDVTDKSMYTGWDGDYLFLSNGEKLIAVDIDK